MANFENTTRRAFLSTTGRVAAGAGAAAALWSYGGVPAVADDDPAKYMTYAKLCAKELEAHKLDFTITVTRKTVGIDLAPIPTAERRYQHHLAGLQAAARELDPEISAWASFRGGYGFGAGVIIVASSDQRIGYGDPVGGF